VFNYTPVYNELEKSFANFLEGATDISKFAALAETYTKFSIPYLNKKGSQGLYYPDFIAEQVLEGGKTINWIIETKGFEDENVIYKDGEALNWCEKATEHTKQEWKYLKVADAFFRGRKTPFSSFSDMLRAVESSKPNKLF
jgi:type III restriction enzyme